MRSCTTPPTPFRTCSSGSSRRAATGTRPDLQLLIRVHPAEISGFPPSRQPILGELRKSLPQLAPNITVVPPESDMSTYALMSLCNAAIIYGTKMGVELTSTGLPVIVAGEAWIRNKGLTRMPARLRNTSRSSLNCRSRNALAHDSSREHGNTPTTSSSIA